jgi:WD40 repeat protein
VGFWPDEHQLLGVSGVEGQSGIQLQKLDLSTLQSDTLAQLSAAPEMLALSPDGRALVYASPDHVLHLVSLPGMQPVAEFHGHTEMVTAASFSPQGDRLYTGSMDRSVRTWDLHGKLLHTFEPPAADGLPSEVMGLAISPDGKQMVIIPGAGAPGLWRVADWHRLGEYPGIISGAYNGAQAAFSPDGLSIAVGLAAGPGSVALWRLAGRGLLWQGGNLAFDLSQDGRYLAMTDPGGGGEAVEIRTADGKNVERVFPQTFDPVVYRLFFSANSSRLAAVNDSLVRVWQVEDGRLLAEYRPACP